MMKRWLKLFDINSRKREELTVERYMRDLGYRRAHQGPSSGACTAKDFMHFKRVNPLGGLAWVKTGTTMQAAVENRLEALGIRAYVHYHITTDNLVSIRVIG